MRTPLRILVSRKKQALKAANPKSRDRIRHELNVLLMVSMLRSKKRAA